MRPAASSKVDTTPALQRGDTMPTGGVFVGERHGVKWVSYEGAADFQAMCETFDRSTRPARTAAAA